MYEFINFKLPCHKCYNCWQNVRYTCVRFLGCESFLYCSVIAMFSIYCVYRSAEWMGAIVDDIFAIMLCGSQQALVLRSNPSLDEHLQGADTST